MAADKVDMGTPTAWAGSVTRPPPGDEADAPGCDTAAAILALVSANSPTLAPAAPPQSRRRPAAVTMSVYRNVHFWHS